MADTDRAIGSTADGLVVIRSGRQARQWGIEDPFAPWFVTEEGRKLVQMAKQVDAAYEELNLARFRYTSSLLTHLASRYGQMLVLGAGFDCRALWLDGLKEGRVRVYEVDTRSKMDQKLQELQRRGVVIPEWNRHIACDLRKADLKALLKAEGMEPEKPVLVLAEGLFYYLPAPVAARVLDPKSLDLAKGSIFIFDCWSAARVEGLNGRVLKRIGSELFHPFPYTVEPGKLTEELRSLEYARVQVTSLGSRAEVYFGRVIEDEFPSSWWVVEATV
jgi:methyltransferase (TIGR00027 family)